MISTKHKYDVETHKQGNLVHHYSRCGCVPVHVKLRVVSRSREQITREIIQADTIEKTW